MERPLSGTVTHALSRGRRQREVMDLTQALEASAEEGQRMHTHAYTCTHTYTRTLIGTAISFTNHVIHPFKVSSQKSPKHHHISFGTFFSSP